MLSQKGADRIPLAGPWPALTPHNARSQGGIMKTPAPGRACADTGWTLTLPEGLLRPEPVPGRPLVVRVPWVNCPGLWHHVLPMLARECRGASSGLVAPSGDKV